MNLVTKTKKQTDKNPHKTSVNRNGSSPMVINSYILEVPRCPVSVRTLSIFHKPLKSISLSSTRKNNRDVL